MNRHMETNEMNSVLKKTGDYNLTDLSPVNHEVNTSDDVEEISKLKTYKPLIIVFLYIILGVEILLIRSGEFNWMDAMNNFMGGFFMIFSFFKCLT